jgi:predicted DNA binding CopG/RHH family protein
MARPNLPDDQKRKLRTVLYATDSQWDEIKQRASAEGLPVSTFLVNSVLKPKRKAK